MTYKQVLKLAGLCAVLAVLAFFFTDSLPPDLKVVGILVSGVLGFAVGRAAAPWIWKD